MPVPSQSTFYSHVNEPQQAFSVERYVACSQCYVSVWAANESGIPSPCRKSALEAAGLRTQAGDCPKEIEQIVRLASDARSGWDWKQATISSLVEGM
jgi:hypothetical protein